MPLELGKNIVELLPMLGIIIFMIVMTVIPQRKRSKEVKKMMDEMKKGDWVVTIGGLSGRITAMRDDYVTIETGPQHVQLTYTRGAIKSVGEAAVEAEGLTEAQISVATKSDKKK
jgi:preprotein translocase subunit YajC